MESKNQTIYILKIFADDYSRFDPRVTENLLGSKTRINHEGKVVYATILDVEVEDISLILTLEI